MYHNKCIIGYKQRFFRERISSNLKVVWWLSRETFLTAAASIHLRKAALGGDFDSQELLAKKKILAKNN